MHGGRGADGAACGGILKSATISFGQSLVAEDLIRAEAGRRGVRPAAGGGLDPRRVPRRRARARRRAHGAVVVIVNGGPTEMDSLADVVVDGSISECLPALVEGCRRRDEPGRGGRRATSSRW